MVPILKIVSVISCSVVVYLSLPTVTQADEYRKFDWCTQIPGRQLNSVKCSKNTQQGIHTITGEILHMNSANLLVKKTGGEEVLLRIDLYTQLGGQIRPGSRIEAKVNEVEGENYALSINKSQ